MATDSGKTFNGKKVGYSIKDDGYEIYLDGNLWITQLDQYARPIIPDGSYEENCLAQIEEICNPPEPEPTEEEKLRADVDYIAAVTGIEL